MIGKKTLKTLILFNKMIYNRYYELNSNSYGYFKGEFV